MKTETQTAHTPGPWTCTIDDEGFNVFQDDPKHPGNGDHIMCIAGNPESEANARLIAAAPELLAMLRDMIGLLDANAYALACKAGTEGHDDEPEPKSIDGFNRNPRIERARAAIAKAEGRAI